MMMVLAPLGGMFMIRPATVIESTVAACAVMAGDMVANRTMKRGNKRDIFKCENIE
jgi:hypothetical protein